MDWSGHFECVGEACYQGGRVRRNVVVRVRDVSWEMEKKKEVRNARIRILLLKLFPASPEVWRSFVVWCSVCICFL